MSWKKFSLAFVACFLINNVMATAWYTVTASLNKLAFTRPEPIYWLLILNHVVFASILAYVYPIGYQGGKPLAEGARFGALMGTLMFLPTALVVRGAWTVPVNLIFVGNTLLHIATGAVCGIAIAMIYGELHKSQ